MAGLGTRSPLAAVVALWLRADGDDDREALVRMGVAAIALRSSGRTSARQIGQIALRSSQRWRHSL